MKKIDFHLIYVIAGRLLVPCENTHGPECPQKMTTVNDERERECVTVSKMETIVLKVESHNFCCILLITKNQ